MKGTVLYGPRDIRFERRDDPKIIEPTDAILCLAETCVCGSDLWPYRGIQKLDGPTPMGHEYCGIVEEIGSAVKSIKPGQSWSVPSQPPTTPGFPNAPARGADCTRKRRSIERPSATPGWSPIRKLRHYLASPEGRP